MRKCHETILHAVKVIVDGVGKGFGDTCVALVADTLQITGGVRLHTGMSGVFIHHIFAAMAGDTSQLAVGGSCKIGGYQKHVCGRQLRPGDTSAAFAAVTAII